MVIFHSYVSLLEGTPLKIQDGTIRARAIPRHSARACRPRD